jgi:hypothetical protein
MAAENFKGYAAGSVPIPSRGDGDDDLGRVFEKVDSNGVKTFRIVSLSASVPAGTGVKWQLTSDIGYVAIPGAAVTDRCIGVADRDLSTGRQAVQCGGYISKVLLTLGGTVAANTELQFDAGGSGKMEAWVVGTGRANGVFNLANLASTATSTGAMLHCL